MTATANNTHAAALDADRNREIVLSLGLLAFSGQELATLSTLPGGDALLAQMLRATWDMEEAQSSAQREVAALQRQAAQIAEALQAGQRVDTTWTTQSNRNLGEALDKRQRAADAWKTFAYIATGMLTA